MDVAVDPQQNPQQYIHCEFIGDFHFPTDLTCFCNITFHFSFCIFFFRVWRRLLNCPPFCHYCYMLQIVLHKNPLRMSHMWTYPKAFNWLQSMMRTLWLWGCNTLARENFRTAKRILRNGLQYSYYFTDYEIKKKYYDWMDQR